YGGAASTHSPSLRAVPGASYSTSQVGILPASCLGFRLTIRKQAASAIPSVCLDGELKKPTR
ncbi:hypothetical protein, partial [Xanthomonas phaseoli]|uniref:hypothetical protein n=1 Tax=Xanthomonas phaseoli TaxID=1985254 RepID=UPI003CCF1596